MRAIFFLFILINDKSLTDLLAFSLVSAESDRKLIEVSSSYLTGGLFVVIVWFFLARVIVVTIGGCSLSGNLSGLFVKVFVFFFLVQQGFVLEQVQRAH